MVKVCPPSSEMEIALLSTSESGLYQLKSTVGKIVSTEEHSRGNLRMDLF